MRNQSQKLKKLQSLFKSFRVEPRVGSDNNPIRADEEVSFRDVPSFSEFNFGVERSPVHSISSGYHDHHQYQQQPAASQLTLQIETDHTLNRQISPHRSPPNKPYVSGSSLSDDEAEGERERSNSLSFDSHESTLPLTPQLKPPPRESVVFVPPKSPFRLVPQMPAMNQIGPVEPVELEEAVGSESSSLYSAEEEEEEEEVVVLEDEEELHVPETAQMSPVRANLPPRLKRRQSMLPGSRNSKFSIMSPYPGALGGLARQSMRQSVLRNELNLNHSSHNYNHNYQPPQLRISAARPPSRRRMSRQSIAKPAKMDKRESKRVSIASSMASMLPYILKYNSDDWEPLNHSFNQSQTSIGHYLAVEDPNSVPKLSAPQQIERMLVRQAMSDPVQPLRLKKKANEDPTHPCRVGVEAYADALDKEFEQYQGIEPDSEFRERILRGTTSSVRRRTRFVDKDLPALPTAGKSKTKGTKNQYQPQVTVLDKPSRLNTLVRKFRLT